MVFPRGCPIRQCLRLTDCTQNRLTLESSLVEMVKDDFLELLVDFLLFPQDNIPLPLDCAGVQL